VCSASEEKELSCKREKILGKIILIFLGEITKKGRDELILNH